MSALCPLLPFLLHLKPLGLVLHDHLQGETNAQRMAVGLFYLYWWCSKSNLTFSLYRTCQHAVRYGGGEGEGCMVKHILTRNLNPGHSTGSTMKQLYWGAHGVFTSRRRCSFRSIAWRRLISCRSSRSTLAISSGISVLYFKNE